MRSHDDRLARLGAFFALMKLGPSRVEARARRLAPLLRLRPISRVHLHRLWYGKSEATPGRMRLIVAAARSLTGLWVTAADLFDLEPDLTIVGPSVLLGHLDPPRGATRRLSLFSACCGLCPTAGNPEFYESDCWTAAIPRGSFVQRVLEQTSAMNECNDLNFILLIEDLVEHAITMKDK